MTTKKKLLIIISSPSGGGKTTICKKLLEEESSPIFGEAEFSISLTTRKKRGNEMNGKDYIFVSEEEFKEKIKNREFLEYAKVFDNFYGTLLSGLSKTKHTIFDIDFQGHHQIKEKVSALSIFLLPPSIETLRSRVEKRGDITKEEIEKRIKMAPEEIEEANKYDYKITNESIEETFKEVCKIISMEITKLNNQI